MFRTRLMILLLLAALAPASAAAGGRGSTGTDGEEDTAARKKPPKEPASNRAPEGAFSAQRTATFDASAVLRDADGEPGGPGWQLTGVPQRGDSLSPVSRLHVVLKNLDPRFDYALSIGEVEFDPQENRPFEFDSSVIDLVFPEVAEVKRTPGASNDADPSKATADDLSKRLVADASAARAAAVESCRAQTEKRAGALAPYLTDKQWRDEDFRTFVKELRTEDDKCAPEGLQVERRLVTVLEEFASQITDANRADVEAALTLGLGLPAPSPLSLTQADREATAKRIAAALGPSPEVADLLAVRKRLDDLIATLATRNDHRRWEQDFGPWKANRIVTPRVTYRRAVPAVASGDALVSHLADKVRLTTAQTQRDEALTRTREEAASASKKLAELETAAAGFLDTIKGAESAADQAAKGAWTKWRETVEAARAGWTGAKSKGETLASTADKATAKGAKPSEREAGLGDAVTAAKAIIEALNKLEAPFELPAQFTDNATAKAAQSKAEAARTAALDATKKASASATSAKELTKKAAALDTGDDTVDPGEAGQAETSLYVVRARVLRGEAGLVVSFLNDPDYAFENGLIVNNGRRFQVHGVVFLGHYWAPRAFHRPMRAWERAVPTVRVGVSISDKIWENLFVGLAWEPVRDLVFGAGVHLGPIQGLPDGLAVGDARPAGFADGAGVPNQPKAGVAPFFSISIEGSLLPRLFNQSTPANPVPLEDEDEDDDDSDESNDTEDS